MSVVDIVMLKIGELELSVGDRLPSERCLAERCDISRSSVRNALKELQSKRILSVRQGSGYFLASDFAFRQALDGQDSRWTPERIQQVFEARSLVTVRVTELGSARMSEQVLPELENTLVDLGKAVINSDVQSMEPLHNRFVNIIFEQCGNAEFIRMLHEVRIPSHYVVLMLQETEGDEKNAYFSEHVNLFQAIKKQDHQLAGQISARICGMLSDLFNKYAHAVFK